jgi:hypothetical protein
LPLPAVGGAMHTQPSKPPALLQRCAPFAELLGHGQERTSPGSHAAGGRPSESMSGSTSALHPHSKLTSASRALHAARTPPTRPEIRMAADVVMKPWTRKARPAIARAARDRAMRSVAKFAHRPARAADRA